MKLLQKMGFKGRLGKNEDGVTRQLEVKTRPDSMGLGFGNFRESTTLKVMETYPMRVCVCTCVFDGRN